MEQDQLEKIRKDIDDRIDLWHESDTENSLREFLGWTYEEYKAWVEDGTIPEKELTTGG